MMNCSVGKPSLLVAHLFASKTDVLSIYTSVRNIICLNDVLLILFVCETGIILCKGTPYVE